MKPFLSAEIPFRQRGIALFVSLLLLFIMTVAAVSAMGSVSLQERMSGNTRVQAKAFEAASAGISAALPYAMEHFDSPPSGQDGCNVSDHADGWTADWSSPVAVGTDSEYRLRLYCLANETFADEAGYEDAGIDIPPQLFVLSEGRVVVDGETLSQRQIEVRVGKHQASVRSDSAIRFEGEPKISFEAPNSNAFHVDGRNGPAISASTKENRDVVFDAIKDNDRVANYDGGIHHTEYGPPWNAPNELSEMAKAVRDFVSDSSNSGKASSCSTQIKHIKGKASGSNGQGGGGGGSKTVPSGQSITYIEGDLDMSGSETADGVIIVEGKITWSGTPDFTGIMIGLGGSYELNGGGNGEPYGSLFLTNLDVDNPGAGFGSTSAVFKGGGNHSMRYDCDQLAQKQQLLGCIFDCDPNDENPPPRCKWEQNCDSDSNNLALGLTVTSWRENTGWREGLFDPE